MRILISRKNYKTIKVRFSTEAKFHLDSGGGGPESNLKLIPYLIQSTLYILNQTKQYQTYKDLIDNSKFDIVQATAVQGNVSAKKKDVISGAIFTLNLIFIL